MDLPEKVVFHYIKSPDYRSIFVEGVIGGVTPKGRIQMSLFSEHMAVPQRTGQKVNQDGTLGDVVPEDLVVREGIVRDLSATLLFDYEMANKIVEWLTNGLKKLIRSNLRVRLSQEVSADGG